MYNTISAEFLSDMNEILFRPSNLITHSNQFLLLKKIKQSEVL